MARALECDEDKERFEEKLGKIATLVPKGSSPSGKIGGSIRYIGIRLGRPSAAQTS
jgi:hypothetical protein